jgi:hypothetical protein
MKKLQPNRVHADAINVITDNEVTNPTIAIGHLQ